MCTIISLLTELDITVCWLYYVIRNKARHLLQTQNLSITLRFIGQVSRFLTQPDPVLPANTQEMLVSKILKILII